MLNVATRVTKVATTWCQFKLLVLFFCHSQSCKVILINANSQSSPAGFIVCASTLCHMFPLPLLWGGGGGGVGWRFKCVCVCGGRLSHVCLSWVCGGAAGHVNSSSYIHGWRVPLSSPSSSSLRKMLPASNSLDRPAAPVSVLTWRCVRLFLFWIVKAFGRLRMRCTPPCAQRFCKLHVLIISKMRHRWCIREEHKSWDNRWETDILNHNVYCVLSERLAIRI